MTPDVKRLCEVVERAYRDWYGDHGAMGAECAEAIVRAVLLELQNVSDQMVEAAEDDNDWHEGVRNGIRSRFSDMIAAILTDPAKA